MQVGALPGMNGISGNPVSNGEMSEETFLKLLTTQLQHQDPLEPASDVEFIEQMATFASLEQQRLTNSNLGVIQLYQSSLNNSNALNIVGKDVKVQNSSITHEGGSHTFFYESDSEATNVHISVVDEDGKEVYKRTENGATDGEKEWVWHGKDNDGNAVPPGKYRARVFLEGEDGTMYPSTVFQQQKVDGIAYENNTIMLLVGDKRIPIENVVEVFEGDTVSESASDTPSLKQGKNGLFSQGNMDLFSSIPGFAEQARSFQPLQQPFRVITGGR